MTITVRSHNAGQCVTLQETLTEAGHTAWVRIEGPVTVQYMGSSATLSGYLARLAHPPSDNLDYAYVGSGYSDSPQDGCFRYNEASGIGWYRFSVGSLDADEDVNITISGNAG